MTVETTSAAALVDTLNAITHAGTQDDVRHALDHHHFAPDAERALRRLVAIAESRLRAISILERERAVAATLQASLLPSRIPELAWADVAVRYESGAPDIDVGGDWFDVIPLGWERVVLSIGDVSGKGVEAAAVMGSIRHALRAYAIEDNSPADALGKMNAVMDVRADARFATVLLADYDRRTRILRVASAGHLAPLHIRASGVVGYVDIEPGPPIGIRSNVGYTHAMFQLHPDTTLVMFTDGLVESRTRGIDVGLDTLREVTQQHANLPLDELLDTLLLRLVGDNRRDDIAMLAFRPIGLTR